MRYCLSAGLFLLAIAEPALAASELADQVTIRRTAYGIPHILGETEAAAAYGFAWAQCEDHFPLVYQAMVRGRSEMSRRYGATEDHIEYDFQTRQLRGRHLAVARYHTLPADYRAVMAGYAAGVTDYMAAHPEEVADWMTPVTPHDVAAAWRVAVMRFTFLRGNMIGKLRDAVVKQISPKEALRDVVGEAMGSNAIALAPSRSKRGHAMLLNNPHQPWSPQARYYEAHIMVPGEYNFYGSTFAGGPILTTGFNEHLGWAHTVNHPDLFELYELTLDPEQPDHYLFDGGSVPLEHETITIQTADGETLSRDFSWSAIGPVIHRTADKAYILRSAGYETYQSGVQWYRMTQASSMAEFREALRMQAIPMFNVAYADRAGNIMYLWNGTIPKLPHAGSKATPVPAMKTADIWTSFHAMDDLMQLTNPEGGYVQNCNSPPYFTNLHARLDRSKYPSYFPDNDLSLRTQHGLQLIHNDKKFSLDDLAAAKWSARLLYADRIKDDLIGALKDASLTEEEAQAVAMLGAWDNTANADSVGGALFELWWDFYRKGSPDFAVEWDESEPMSTPRGLGDPARGVESFRKAVAEAKARWGRWDVSWGEVHRLRRGDKDLPMGGADGFLGSFRACEYYQDDDGKWVMDSGDGFVFVVEFGEEPRAQSVLGYSQSGRLDSPHYNDQAELFAEGKMKPVAFNEADIAGQLLREYKPGE